MNTIASACRLVYIYCIYGHKYYNQSQRVRRHGSGAGLLVHFYFVRQSALLPAGKELRYRIRASFFLASYAAAAAVKITATGLYATLSLAKLAALSVCDVSLYQARALAFRVCNGAHAPAQTCWRKHKHMCDVQHNAPN